MGFSQETFTEPVFSQSYQYRRCRFHGKVGCPRFFGAKIHCIEFGLVGQILDVPASFSLTASVIMAEIKTSRKDHDVKGVVQAEPFQLCHMRQVESVCVRATNRVHSALAGLGRLACPCGAAR